MENRLNDSFKKIISSNDILSKDEELYLFMNLNAKNREKLIYSNIKLVYDIAKRFSYNLDINDVISCGIEALIKAIDSFDYSKENSFSTFAYVAIERALRRNFNNEKLIRIPERKIETILKIKDKIKNKEILENRLLSENEIRELLEEDEYEIYNYHKISILSLDNSINDSENSYKDMIKDEEINHEEKLDNLELINKVRNYLANKDSLTFNIYNDFIDGYNVFELEDKYKLNKKDIRDILSKTKNELRNAFLV